MTYTVANCPHSNYASLYSGLSRDERGTPKQIGSREHRSKRVRSGVHFLGLSGLCFVDIKRLWPALSLPCAFRLIKFIDATLGQLKLSSVYVTNFPHQTCHMFLPRLTGELSTPLVKHFLYNLDDRPSYYVVGLVCLDSLGTGTRAALQYQDPRASGKSRGSRLGQAGGLL